MARYDFTEYLEHRLALDKLEASVPKPQLEHHLHICGQCGAAHSRLSAAAPPASWLCERCETL